MYTYRYNFANEGVISTHKNVLAYILCISVVDHTDVTVDEIIYLASEFAGDGQEQYGVYLTELIEKWKELKNSDFIQPAKVLPIADNLRDLALR